MSRTCNIKNSFVDNFVAPECKQQIEILFQDKNFLLINKPSGLLSLSGKNPLNKDSVHYRLVQDFPTATMVHRLDLGTSGIMVIALNKLANANLAKQFQSRTVIKTYISMLAGHLSDNKGQINAPIAKDPLLFPKVKICAQDGKQAQTDYHVIERISEPNITRVRFFPKTGRTHQLRIHSQHVGYPMLGCDLYGANLDGNIRPPSKDSHHIANRLMLHAERLEFDHPITGKRIIGVCACPF